MRKKVDGWALQDANALPPPPAPPRTHLTVSHALASARAYGGGALASGEPDYEDVRAFVASELVG